jgi:other hect domain ubiquitin protein ligase E3
MIKPRLTNQNPDQALPKADTCFFNIELPQYSSKNVMKNRVLLAVNLDSTSINADRNMMPDENPLMGNVDYEDEEEND